MENVIIPTVGRCVYYKSRGSADGVFPSVDRAAIITDVRHSEHADATENDYQVRLSVFNPEGLFFTDWLDQGQAGGNWDWMPFQKDQQARLAKEEAPISEDGEENQPEPADNTATDTEVVDEAKAAAEANQASTAEAATTGQVGQMA